MPVTYNVRKNSERTKEISMFLTLFVVLLVMWLLGFLAFHIAGGLIHLLLIIAVISLVMHLFRGRSSVWKPDHVWPLACSEKFGQAAPAMTIFAASGTLDAPKKDQRQARHGMV
jgi:hypothetical protein